MDAIKRENKQQTLIQRLRTINPNRETKYKARKDLPEAKERRRFGRVLDLASKLKERVFGGGIIFCLMY